MRGKPNKVGDTRVTQNGYHQTRTKDGWRYTHQLIAETKLGRLLSENEWAYFVDRNKKNLNPDNIDVKIIKPKPRSKEVLGALTNEERIEALELELSELRALVESLGLT